MKPSYLTLHKSGELEQRAAALEARLESCDICPRNCRVNRLKGETGFCHSGNLPIVSSFCAHHGEEPVLSGTQGSGTIFFGNCNMACVYCQNFQISQDWRRQKAFEVSCETLAERMLYLQDKLGCHNINLVSPSHFVPQIVRALTIAIPEGLHIPLVYNTGGYDSLDTIKALDGIVDIYLPDLRYASDEDAREYSGAPTYVSNARSSIKEMFRQVGEVVTDGDGIARRGVIVRILILPNEIGGCEESLEFLAKEVSPDIYLSVMSQYSPQHRAMDFPLLSRKISGAEYARITAKLNELGMENGWVQEMTSSDYYLPDFKREGHPFVR